MEIKVPTKHYQNLMENRLSKPHFQPILSQRAINSARNRGMGFMFDFVLRSIGMKYPTKFGQNLTVNLLARASAFTNLIFRQQGAIIQLIIE